MRPILYAADDLELGGANLTAWLVAHDLLETRAGLQPIMEEDSSGVMALHQ